MKKINNMQRTLLLIVLFLTIQQINGMYDYDDDWDIFTNDVIPMADYEPKTLDQSLIQAACSPHDTTLVPSLIAQGANPNYQWYPSTQTALYLASFFGNFDNVVFLINAGADPNIGEGALLGVLRGIREDQFDDIEIAHKILIFLISHNADYKAQQVQEIIEASPYLKEHLTLAIQQSKYSKKAL